MAGAARSSPPRTERFADDRCEVRPAGEGGEVDQRRRPHQRDAENQREQVHRSVEESCPHAGEENEPYPRGVAPAPFRESELRPAPGQEHDTFFFKTETAPSKGNPPDFRDPMTRYLGHFDDAQMPPYSQLQMEGYRGSSIFGISLKMLVDHMLGAQHLTLFMVEFQPGGEGNIHDHPFEETYFLLSGEAEAILDGKTYHVKAGDYVWNGVGGTHGFFNKGAVPVRWIETQAPQPPNQQGFRFPADWAYLAEKLEAQDSR